MPDTEKRLPTAAVSLAVPTLLADPVVNLEIRINGETSQVDTIHMCIDPRWPTRVILYFSLPRRTVFAEEALSVR
jgi:hypothetical protein